MIYCVEDDRSIRELVVYALKSGGFEAEGFDCGGDFFLAVKDRLPALVLLDVMLPGEDGIDILRRLKASGDTREIPVVMLTARSAEYDKVLGLDSGADDYVTKPFGVVELLSRIRAVLRRTGNRAPQPKLAVGGVTLDSERRRVTSDGREVTMTFKEFELLRYLMENAGIVLSRDRILQSVWGYDFQGETRTVDMHVRALRQKLGEAGSLIETVRGVGYRMGVRT
jgi:two-component system alkaline phosphatase synthesis response regulator PhoP